MKGNKEDLCQEEWKGIEGYDRKYLVSNLGRVYSLKSRKELKPYTSSKGYFYVSFSKKSKVKKYSVHRLVAINFIPKHESEEVLIVKHKDGVKTNNRVRNLEWVTYSENKVHATKTGLHVDNVEGLHRYNDSRKKKVSAYKDGVKLHTAEYSREMAKWLQEYDTSLTRNLDSLSATIRRKMNTHVRYFEYYFRVEEN